MKRPTIGQRLKTARLESKCTVLQLVQRILADNGEAVSVSTVRGIENDSTPNPGIKTIEAIAKGVRLDPMEVISLGFDEPPETESGYSNSQFAQLAGTYKKIKKENKPVADQLIKILMEQMERWQ